MPVLSHSTQPAARGHDVTSDPGHLAPATAALLQNLLPDRLGLLRGNVALDGVFPAGTFAGPLQGVGFYRGVNNWQDRMLIAAANAPAANAIGSYLSQALYADVPNLAISQQTTINVPYPPTFATPQSVFDANGNAVIFPYPYNGQPANVNTRARFLQFLDEVYLFQESVQYAYGGLFTSTFPKVYWVDWANATTYNQTGTVLAAGNPPPTGDAVMTATIQNGGQRGLGVVEYAISYVDWKGRESSLGPLDSRGFFTPAAVTYQAQNQASALITVDLTFLSSRPVPPQATFINLYTTVVGDTSGNYYRLHQWANPSGGGGVLTYTDDQFTDSQIEQLPVGPQPGENDTPNPASFGCVYRNRLILNDLTDPNGIQVSALNNPTAYASLVYFATDGLRFRAGNDAGDYVTAFVPFGAMCLIMKRGHTYVLQGDGATDFALRPVAERGCIAPDSAVRCDNVAMFLSDDGVYAWTAGAEPLKISKPIEAFLQRVALSPGGRQVLETAIGWYAYRTYFLAISGYPVQAYSFDTEGWYQVSD